VIVLSEVDDRNGAESVDEVPEGFEGDALFLWKVRAP